MVKENFAKIVELRPGRKLFVRNWILGEGRAGRGRGEAETTTDRNDGSGTSTNHDQDKTTTTTTTTATTRSINLICVHGTASTQEQFLPLLRSLESKLSHHHHTTTTTATTTPQINEVLTTTSTIIIHCWMWDAVGCGNSPKILNSNNTNNNDNSNSSKDAYSDTENVKDIQALIDKYVDKSLPIYFIGHSYGPQWIFKYLSLLLQQRQQIQQQTQAQLVHDSTTKTTEATTTNTTRPLVTIQGLILLSTGLLGDGLVQHGPAIFRVLPLVVLNCLQPLLTRTFLTIGFSPFTHTTQPELIQAAKIANNQNDMEIVCNYYGHHEWLSDLSFLLFSPRQQQQQQEQQQQQTTKMTTNMETSDRSENENDNHDNASGVNTITMKNNFLVLHGVDDGVIPISQGQRVANQLDTKLIPIQNASHMVLLEQPNIVADHITSFLLESM